MKDQRGLQHEKLPEVQALGHPTFSEQNLLPHLPQPQLRGGDQSRGHRPRSAFSNSKTTVATQATQCLAPWMV